MVLLFVPFSRWPRRRDFVGLKELEIYAGRLRTRTAYIASFVTRSFTNHHSPQVNTVTTDQKLASYFLRYSTLVYFLIQ